MKSIRTEIKQIVRAAAVLATISAMTFALAGSANAIVIGPLGNPTVVQAPIGAVVNPIGFRPGLVNSDVGFVRPGVFNPFFRPAAFNPFFRPAFNPFFRPAFFNPFFGADVDVDFGFGLGVGIGEVD